MTIGTREMPRASALAPRASDRLRTIPQSSSIFNKEHKSDILCNIHTKHIDTLSAHQSLLNFHCKLELQLWEGLLTWPRTSLWEVSRKNLRFPFHSALTPHTVMYMDHQEIRSITMTIYIIVKHSFKVAKTWWYICRKKCFTEKSSFLPARG